MQMTDAVDDCKYCRESARDSVYWLVVTARILLQSFQHDCSGLTKRTDNGSVPLSRRSF